MPLSLLPRPEAGSAFAASGWRAIPGSSPAFMTLPQDGVSAAASPLVPWVLRSAGQLLVGQRWDGPRVLRRSLALSTPSWKRRLQGTHSTRAAEAPLLLGPSLDESGRPHLRGAAFLSGARGRWAMAAHSLPPALPWASKVARECRAGMAICWACGIAPASAPSRLLQELDQRGHGVDFQRFPLVVILAPGLGLGRPRLCWKETPVPPTRSMEG